MGPDPLLRLRHVAKLFSSADGRSRVAVLDEIDLDIAAGEVVALLGRSGSGKSSLLRIMAGLLPPTEGVISRDGQALRGVNRDVAIVFQSFALLPWLTVEENTAIGLEARGLPAAEVRHRALKALAMVGLEGNAEAYPRELSGGMRQRVGFARAFVMEPALLLMDEPFSALDILTAENLRRDIDELWAGGRFPARSIVILTHSIEEDELLPILDVGELLQLMEMEEGQLRLTAAGQQLRAAAIFGTLVSWTRSCGLYRYNREQDVFRLAEVGADD